MAAYGDRVEPSAETDAPEVRDAYALDPSKVYAVRVDRPHLTPEQAQRIRDRFKRDGITVIVLGSTVHLIEPEDPPRVTPPVVDAVVRGPHGRRA